MLVSCFLDGGKIWILDGVCLVYVDYYVLWINLKNLNYMLFGNDGGFYISYDKGVIWDYVYNLLLI